jgi:integrase
MAAKMEKTRTPGIYRRGSRYVVVWRHRGKQHKSFHRTYEEAREARGKRQAGNSRPASREPFEDYARQWLDGYGGRTERGISPNGLAEYRSALERFAVPFFGRYRLADIQPSDVRQFARHLEDQELAPTTVRKYLQPVRALFAEAVDDGVLAIDPSARVRVRARHQDPDEGEPAKAMTREEQKPLPPAASWLPFFSLLSETGLRISEALGLEWSDFKFGQRPTRRVRRQFYRGELRPTKTSAGRRELPISAAAARWAKANRPKNPTTVPMFATRTGRRLSDRNVRRALDAVTEDLGLAWVTPHVFRHTCASRLLSDGSSIRQVAGWLGHTDPAFTLRTYVHLMDDGLGEPLQLGGWGES